MRGGEALTQEADPIVVETTSRIFHDLADPKQAHASGDATRQARLWSALENAGLTRAWVDPEWNGAGAGVAEGFAIARTAGAFAVAVPLVETLLASWLLAAGEEFGVSGAGAPIRVPDGPLTVAPVRASDRIALKPDGTVSGRARSVPFARGAEHIALLATQADSAIVALVRRDACEIEPGASIAGDALDHVVLRDVRPVAVRPAAVSSEQLRAIGAALRAAQISGALEAVLELTVAYASERIAFERPIAKFQVIQHNLARLAGETAAALAAAGSAADALARCGEFTDGVLLEVASAKIRAGEAVTAAAAIAHQVHGAIGFTREHVLHRYTQRLWSWRDDFGSESEWAVRLGQLVVGQGADALWPLLTSR